MGRRKERARGLSRTVERRLTEIERCERRGESLKAYAQRTRQSVYGFYEAKRAARRAGVLPSPRSAAKTLPGKAKRAAVPRFVEAVVSSPPERARASAGGVVWRLRWPGGAILESTTPLDPASLERLVARLGESS